MFLYNKWRRLSRARSGMLALLTAVLACSTPAYPWDGAVNGKIGGIDATGGNNYDFRVYAGGLTANACGSGTASWSFLNQTDSNYQVYVSLLTTAYVTNKNVILYLTRDGPNGVYCRIGYVVVTG